MRLSKKKELRTDISIVRQKKVRKNKSKSLFKSQIRYIQRIVEIYDKHLNISVFRYSVCKSNDMSKMISAKFTRVKVSFPTCYKNFMIYFIIAFGKYPDPIFYD